jgi:hypothetical protein
MLTDDDLALHHAAVAREPTPDCRHRSANGSLATAPG